MAYTDHQASTLIDSSLRRIISCVLTGRPGPPSGPASPSSPEGPGVPVGPRGPFVPRGPGGPYRWKIQGNYVSLHLLIHIQNSLLLLVDQQVLRHLGHQLHPMDKYTCT